MSRWRWLPAGCLTAVTAAAGFACVWLGPPTRVPLAPEQADELAVIADGWCERVAGPGWVSADDWPPAVRRLGLESVRVTDDGVYLVRKTVFVTEWGWFVPRPGSRFRPDAIGDPAYWPVYGRVYWYHVAG